jgi:acylphosphatase/regulator of replication initiation timing
LIVTGNVQGAGFRALVKKIARSMGIKGRVQNLDDGTVEIYCEAEESIFERFIKTIDIKHRNGNLLAIDVQAIKQHPEGTAEYHGENAPAPFMAFDIEYGQLGHSLTFAERESLERQELLIVGGTQVLDGLGVVGDKVDNMHEDMNKRFLEMNEKYHVISETMVESNKNLEGMNKNIKELIEGNAKTNENIKNLTETMMKIVEDYIAEKRKHQNHIEGQT